MKRILLAVVAVAMLSSCGNSKNAVAYNKAENYFVNNTFQNTKVETLKIDNKADFDRVFGMATTMSSRPTAIDFGKQTVLAIVAPASNKEVTIRIKALETTLTNGILVKYTLDEGKDLGYTAQSSEIITVNKTDKEVLFQEVF
ncbi:hypothetical protein [Capnocytophaga sp. oral taxon 878]|uniref:hypothetical protein n=1 Tax=Capnocytophaga sp. oral taxon 878 TaxID=1316596 RepID=UPI000D023880|nr:hypothetical protein [Capnocytophaga sp. oral taxon 878]AVM50601.1 hypothetical protein C4H12_09025 [Capnocytophaga sp. oral taxon 878]